MEISQEVINKVREYLEGCGKDKRDSLLQEADIAATLTTEIIRQFTESCSNISKMFKQNTDILRKVPLAVCSVLVFDDEPNITLISGQPTQCIKGLMELTHRMAQSEMEVTKKGEGK